VTVKFKNKKTDTKEDQLVLAKDETLITKEFWRNLLHIETQYQVWLLKGLRNNDHGWNHLKGNWQPLCLKVKFFQHLRQLLMPLLKVPEEIIMLPSNNVLFETGFPALTDILTIDFPEIRITKDTVMSPQLWNSENKKAVASRSDAHWKVYKKVFVPWSKFMVESLGTAQAKEIVKKKKQLLII
jgi:hypothetical protein